MVWGCPPSREPEVAPARGGLRNNNSHCLPHRLWDHHSVGLALRPHLHCRHQRAQARPLPVVSRKRRSSQLVKDAVPGRFVAMALSRHVKVVLRPTLNASRLIDPEIIMYRAGEELRVPNLFFPGSGCAPVNLADFDVVFFLSCAW